MPLAMATDEPTTAFCSTPRQTGLHLPLGHPRASKAKRNGGLSRVGALEATMTKPLPTAGVVLMLAPVAPCQMGSQEPPGGVPQPVALKAETLPAKSGSEPKSAM